MAYSGEKGGEETASFIANNIKETCYVHKSESKEVKSADLYIRFGLGDPRVTSGKVFEDTLTQKSKKQDGTDESNVANLGDGILTNDETNRAQDTTVELLNSDMKRNTRTTNRK